MNTLLYLIPSLIWGTTWYAIKLQTFGSVPLIWSVAYRFAIATAILFFICLFSAGSLRFNRKQHASMALQGLALFCLNYIFLYYSEQYLVSGIVGLIGAIAAIMNIINSRIFLGSKNSLRTFLASTLGLVGLVMVLWTEIIDLTHQHMQMPAIILGITLALAGTYCASMGNILSAYNQKKQHLPVLQSNFFSMVYGTLFITLTALMMRQPIKFDFSGTYTLSLLYLAILGTVITFQTYLTLVGRIGPARAAYVFVITPVIALLISTYFEGFVWGWYKILGVVLILIGNVLIINTKKNAVKTYVDEKKPCRI